jgi:hypothetical protein
MGLGNNDWFCENADLPWLQDTSDANWWEGWQVNYRDLVILDRNGDREAVFNLTQHDLWDDDEFETLKALLLDIAQSSN